MADIEKVNAEVAKTGLADVACSDVNRGAGKERDSYVRIVSGPVTHEIGYWDDELNRARTDAEIAAIAKTLCTATKAERDTKAEAEAAAAEAAAKAEAEAAAAEAAATETKP